MNYEDIVKEKYKIQNKWIETKEDELDIALNLIDELIRLKLIMIHDFARICRKEMPKNVSATEFIVIQNKKIKELENRLYKIKEYIINNRDAVDERDGKILYWLKDSFDEEEILEIANGVIINENKENN